MLRAQLASRHETRAGWEHPPVSPGLNYFPSGPEGPGRPPQTAHPYPEETPLETKPTEGGGSCVQSTALSPRASGAASPCNQGEINVGWSTELRCGAAEALSKCWVTS